MSAQASSSEARLSVRGVQKHFGPVQALYNVDLDLPAGKVTALCGDNGAGKSVLIKTVSGIYEPDHGQIFWEGRPVRVRTAHDASALGIETVYQDLALCDNLDVVANMFLGRETAQPQLLGPIRELSMEKQALAVLEGLHVTTIPSVRQRVVSLSGGQRQSVAISRAVMWTAKVVILDEPTAALGVAQTEQVLALIRRLREQGLGVVVITHNLHEVFEVADRIIVLRLGRRAATFTHAGTSPEDVVAAITGARR